MFGASSLCQILCWARKTWSWSRHTSCPPRDYGGETNRLQMKWESCVGYGEASKKILSVLPGEAWEGFKEDVKPELRTARWADIHQADSIRENILDKSSTGKGQKAEYPWRTGTRSAGLTGRAQGGRLGQTRSLSQVWIFCAVMECLHRVLRAGVTWKGPDGSSVRGEPGAVRQGE